MVANSLIVFTDSPQIKQLIDSIRQKFHPNLQTNVILVNKSKYE